MANPKGVKAGPKTFRVTIEGNSPMIQNRCNLLEGGGKKMSKAEIAEKTAHEWKDKAYFAPNMGVFLPASHIERAIAVAAGNWKLSKTITATVFSADALGFPIRMKGLPQFSSVEDFSKHNLIDRRNVKMNRGSSVSRARPFVPTGWQATVELVVLSPEINGDTLKQIIEHAGRYTGLGDYRPKYGRFNIVSFEEVS